MSIKTYNVKLNGKVYEVEIEEVKAHVRKRVNNDKRK